MLVPGLESQYNFPDRKLPYFQICGTEEYYKKRRHRHSRESN